MTNKTCPTCGSRKRGTRNAICTVNPDAWHSTHPPVAEPATPPQAGRDLEQQQFEAFAYNPGPDSANLDLSINSRGDYASDRTDGAWHGWQARGRFDATPPVAESAPSALEPYAWFWSHNRGAKATGNDGVLTLRQDYEQHKRDYPGMEFTPVVLQADAEAAIRKARDQYHYWHALALELCERECFSVCRNINADGSCPMDIERRKAMTDKTESAGQDFCEMCKSTDEATFHSPCRDGIPHNWHFKNLRYKTAPQPAPEQQVKRYSLMREGAGTYVLYSDYKRDLSAATQRAEELLEQSNTMYEAFVAQQDRANKLEASLKEREAEVLELRNADVVPRSRVVAMDVEIAEWKRKLAMCYENGTAEINRLNAALAIKPEGQR